MDFQIKDSIPTEDKFDLINLSLREATIDGMLNSAVLTVLFKINTILEYTDIFIPEEYGYNKVAFYDFLVQENVINKFDEEVNKNEMDILNNYLELWTDDYRNHLYSMRGIVEVIKDAIYEMTNQTSESLGALKDLNLDELKEILPLAEAMGINYDKVKDGI